MNTEEFIIKFASEDVHKLALKASKYPEVDIQYALNQISGRQSALKKLPTWSAVEGVIYPPRISMEQCSSEFTARYKHNLLMRISGDDYMLTDLTGGFGVDFIYMSERSRRAVYVEQNPILCQTVNKNLLLFGRDNAEVINCQAEDFLKKMDCTDVIYVDPARRDSSGARTYAISDCTPDVLQLLPQLLEKAHYVLIKLSPMLDHNKAVSDINKVQRCVKEVHIVSVSGECKELLLLLSSDATEGYKIYCINDEDEYSYNAIQSVPPLTVCKEEHFTGMYLYEPNASIMKAGCFANLSRTYNVSALATNSNIFVSREIIKDFPGRSFHILKETTMNKKELKKVLSGISKANLTVRNFPMSVVELRKRLKIREGGTIYIFATTSFSGNHVLLICEKI